MKKNMDIFLILLVNLVFSSSVFAMSKLHDKQFIRDTPAYLMNLKKSTGQSLKYGDDISLKSVEIEYGKQKYIAVLYIAQVSMTDRFCDLKAYKMSANMLTSIPVNEIRPKQKNGSELNGCTSIKAIDLDGNGIKEIVVNTQVAKHEYPYFFQISNGVLQDITPSKKDKDGINGTAFRDAYLTKFKVDGKYLIVDKEDEYFYVDPVKNAQFYPDPDTRVYSFENGAINLIGRYAFYDLFVKSNNAENGTTIGIPSPGAGDYILTVRNVSSGKDSVRADVLFNGQEILKSMDFCQEKPTPRDFGNSSDKNEDGYRGCKQKSDIYANVAMRKTENNILVKIYGATGSVLEVSLKKK